MTSLRIYSLKISFIEHYRGWCIIKQVDKFYIYPADKCYFSFKDDEIAVVDAPYRSIACANIDERLKRAKIWIDRIIKGVDDDD